MSRSSKVLRFERYRWNSVPLREYKAEGSRFKAITRQTLIGEGAGEEPLNFVTRYFEIQPGGYSSLERHHHPHSVMVIRGTGRVVLDDQVHPIGPLDCVYVAPSAVHQFQATGSEPLGFLCVVDRERDRPVPVPAGEANHDAARS
jgi:quercetin dioxygenase-like cupin family protein